jgi:hypothetical protein
MIIVILVIPSWWIFDYEMSYEIRFQFAFNVFLDAYYYMLMCVCFDQTCILGHEIRNVCVR